MLHHLAGATIQVVNLVSYNCHSQKYGKNTSEYDQDLQQPQTTDQSKAHKEET